ncbi:hypothetical protein H4217_003036 [Coemansia sp. RSA 1939]|nr:hypothetical protein H4217_003036 [Coemansia sp. RSA 1939]KAJ2612914.1 hypothetical protein EV177_002764 [Coemansia sp. RSA 1804]
MSAQPSPITSTFIATATINHPDTTTGGQLQETVDVNIDVGVDIGADAELGSEFDPGNENAVSLVAVLCGLVPCMPNSINNIRLVNQSSDSVDENSDKVFDPFYHPSSSSSSGPPPKSTSKDYDSDSEDSFENSPMNAANDDGGKELTTDKSHSPNVARNAAIGASVGLVVLVLFILYVVRRRNKRRRRLMLGEGDDLSTHSNGSTAALPVAHMPGGGGFANRLSAHRPSADHPTSAATLSPFASPLPPTAASRASAGPEMVQLPMPSRARSAADVGRRRRRPPPPPPPPTLGRSENPHAAASAAGAGDNRTHYADQYPPQPPPTLARRASLALDSGRQRAATFSEISGDELPPYIDPIEEAMTSAAHRPDEGEGGEGGGGIRAPSHHHHHTNNHNRDPQRPNPPPYYAIDLSR